MAFETLERLFSSRTRIGLLSLFFMQPDQRYYVRQIARELKRDISGIKRELDNLERAGLLTSEKVGNLRYYAANRAAPLFAEIKGIIDKTVGVAATLEQSLKGIPGVHGAFLYSTNAHVPGEGLGDIDLLIVGRVDLREVNALAAKKAIPVLPTSAKTGFNVEPAFSKLTMMIIRDWLALR